MYKVKCTDLPNNLTIKIIYNHILFSAYTAMTTLLIIIPTVHYIYNRHVIAR